MFKYEVPEKIELSETINSLGRFYYRGREALPSVTTILKNTTSSTFLKHWKARNPGKLEEAGIRGTKMHTLIEDYLRYGKINSECSSYAYFRSIKPLLDNLDVCFLELPVFSKNIGTAGRIDCAAIFNGIPAIIDWKSKAKKSTNLYDYPLQLAAYIKLFEEVYPEYPQKFNYGMIAVATPKNIDLYTFSPFEVEKNFSEFQRRRDTFYRKITA